MDMEEKNVKKSLYMETLRVPSFILAVAVTCREYIRWLGVVRANLSVPRLQVSPLNPPE